MSPWNADIAYCSATRWPASSKNAGYTLSDPCMNASAMIVSGTTLYAPPVWPPNPFTPAMAV